MTSSAAPRLNLRQRQRELTSSALVEAAREVFLAKGYAGASVDDVAVAAGASRATFYLHFRTKRDVAELIIEDVLADSRAATEPLTRLVADPADDRDVEAVVRGWIDFYTRRAGDIRVMLEVAALEPAVGHRLSESLNAAVDALTHASGPHDSPEVHEEVSLVIATMLYMIDRLCWSWQIAGWNLTEDRIVRSIVESWTDYYLPKLRRLVGRPAGRGTRKTRAGAPRAARAPASAAN